MSLAFHKTNNILFSSSADNTIICWDFPSGDIIKILNKHNNWVSFIIIFEREINFCQKG